MGVAFGFVNMPRNVERLFSVWLRSFDRKLRKLITICVAANLWNIWRTRNISCFENKIPSDPITFIHLICHWLLSWAILQKNVEDREAIQLGARLLEQLAVEVFSARQGWRPAGDQKDYEWLKMELDEMKGSDAFGR